MLQAQTPRIDSLRQVVAQLGITGALKDSAALRNMEKMGFLALNAETDSALAITGRSIAIMERFKGPDRNDTITLKRLATAYRYRGLAFQDKNDYTGALKSFQQYQLLVERLGNEKGQGASYLLMAACFREMDDTTKAVLFSHKAIRILEALPASKDLAQAYMGLGGIYSNAGKRDSAAYWFLRAAPLFQRLKSVNKEGAVYLNLVELYLGAGMKDSASKYMEKASIVEEIWKGMPAMGQYDGLKAHLLILQGKFKEATALLREAEGLSDGSPDDLSNIYQLRALAEAGEQRGDSANWYLERGKAMALKNMDLAKARELTKTQLEFEQLKERDRAETRLMEERAQKRNAIIGAALLFALLVLLFSLYRSSRRTSRLLAAKNAEIISAQELLVASEKEREAEQVRTRIARDIHDEIGSELTKLALLSSEAKRRLVEDPVAAGDALSRIGGLSRAASAALNDIVWAVDPAQDTVAQLVRHAQTYTLRMLEGTSEKGELDFSIKGGDRPIDPGTKRDIFLLLKEALNNALKHALATRIDVNLTTDGAAFQLCVKDNGAGYAIASTDAGNGTRSMEARALRLGATLERNSAPGQGCVVTVRGRIGAG